MTIKITVDSTRIRNDLAQLGQDRQAPYIMQRTLNNLARAVQTSLRLELGSKLKLRRAPWINQQIKIDKESWATRTKLFVTIRLTDLGAFLGDFDKGMEHVPTRGRKFLALPNPKVFGDKVISQDNPLRIKNLQLNQTPFGLKGTQRTFMITPKGGRGLPLILQRVASPGKGIRKKGVEKGSKLGTRILYFLLKSTMRPDKIDWFETAENTINTQQDAIVSEAMAKAKSTQR